MPESSRSNNTRIAKNTLLLYIRMLFLMGISLYTSRIVLQVLGITDYGIYNVVGGFVAMFSIVSASLTAAISRFLTYELGRGDTSQLSRIFSSSVTIQIGLSLIIIVLAETIGLWYLNSKMNIPIERISAANWVFQLSLATFVVSLISVPYNSTIIAHEHMGAFAYIGIFDGLAKLAIAFILFKSSMDNLILYAILMFVVAFLVRFLYTLYCKKHFVECTYHFVFDRELLNKMFGFAGWNMIGASAGILRDHGGNLVLNYFLGTAINAARGISIQVQSAVQSFSSNFMMALNPQITKSYAQGDIGYMTSLVFKGAKFSFYILLIISLPIVICTSYIMNIWLVDVPDYTVSFVRLVLILSMSEALSIPLITAILATGDIKKYQIIVGGLNLLNLPIFILLLYFGFSPESIFISEIIISQMCLAARLVLLNKMMGISIRKYLVEVYYKVILVSISSLLPSLILYHFVDETFISFCFTTIICVCSVCLAVWTLGVSSEERMIIKEKISLYLNNKIRNK